MTLPKNQHPADGLKRQRRAPIPAQGKALGAERATAQGLKARPILQNKWGYFLLPVQHSGRLQPIHRQLGSAGVDDRSQDASLRAVPRDG